MNEQYFAVRDQLSDGLVNGVDPGCGLEISGWYKIEVMGGLFMHCVESDVQDIAEILAAAHNKTVYGRLLRSTDPCDVGYDYNDMWSVQVWHTDEKGERAFNHRYSVNLLNHTMATSLALILSRHFKTSEVDLQKWARIRSVWKDEQPIRSFPDAPYTNGPADWL